MTLVEKQRKLEYILDGPINFLKASGLFTKKDFPRPRIKIIKSSKYKGLYAGAYNCNDYLMEIVNERHPFALGLVISHEYFHHVQCLTGYTNYLWQERSKYNIEESAFIRGFEEAGASAFAAFYQASQERYKNPFASTISYILRCKEKESIEALEAIHENKMQEYITIKMRDEKSGKKTKQELYINLIGSAYIGRAIAMFAIKKNNFDFNKSMSYLMGDLYVILNDIKATDISVLKNIYKTD